MKIPRTTIPDSMHIRRLDKTLRVFIRIEERSLEMKELFYVLSRQRI